MALAHVARLRGLKNHTTSLCYGSMMKRYCVEPRSGVLCQRNQQQPGYPVHHAENSTDDIAGKGGGGGLLGFLIFALLPQEIDRAGFDDGEGRQRKTEQCYITPDLLRSLVQP